MSVVATHRSEPAARAKPAAPAAAASPSHDTPRYVQAKCDACEAETKPAEPVQMWSCGEYSAPTCEDKPVQQEEAGDDDVQMWSCGEYSAPTCEDKPVQQACDACEAEDDAEHAMVDGGASGAAVQHDGAPSKSSSPAMVHGAARAGLAGASQSLPHGERIQAAFGHHDVSHVRTAVGGPATGATRRMGALAFTSGDRIGFRSAPDLHLAAHEAAHVVQQRAGLKLPGGVGRAGDRWERHADRVADAVVGGRSAEPLLDEVATPGSSAVTAPVQHALAPPSERMFEPPAVEPELPAPAAPAPKEKKAKAKAEPDTEAAETPDEAMKQADEGVATEAPPAGVEETAGTPPPAPNGGRGAVEGECYNAKSPPRTTEEEPTSDEKSSEPKEEESVTFPPWPDEVDDCQAAEAAAGAGGAATGAAGAGAGAGAGNAVGGAGGGSAGAVMTGTLMAGAAGGAAGAAAGATTEGAAPGGGGATADPAARSQSPEVRKMDDAASTTEDQTAAQGSGMDGTISSAEGARAAAWTDHESSLGDLNRVRDRAPRLEAGISFGEDGEAAARVARGFMSRAGGQIMRALGFADADIPTRLGGLAAATNARIGASIEGEKQSITARIDRAITMAFAGAERARGRVQSEFETSVNTVNAMADAAIAMVDAVHPVAVAAIHAQEAAGLLGVNTRVADGRRRHEDLGPVYATRARNRAQQHVRAYEKCKAGPGNDYERYGDDGFWDGCLTVRRAHAQQKAACETAQGFQDGFRRTANKKGYDLLEVRRQYRCAVISGAGEVTTTLDDAHDQIVEGLESSRTDALQGLERTRRENLAAIDTALSSTVRSLLAQGFAQRQAVNDSGYLKQLAVEQLAHASAAGLARGIGAAMDSLDATLGQLREQFTTADGRPDPEALALALESSEVSLGSGVDLLLTTMEQGTADAEQRTAELGTLAAEALLGITTANGDLVTQVEGGFKTQMSGIVTGASRAFREMTGNHTRESLKAGTDAVTMMTGAVTKFGEGLTTIYTKVEEAITKSLGDLTLQLDGEMDKLDEKIVSEAWKAADQEQPAWKEVVAILLIILVIIAAALISIATLGAGASIFAVILVGAIVGAISAGLIQIINNWSQGKAWHEGLAQAMIMGAIGGAIGGGIGFGAGGLAAAAGSAGARVVTQLAIQVGGDLIAEGITQTIGYVAFGQKFNWQGFVMAGAMSGISFRRTPKLGAPGPKVSANPGRAAAAQIAGGAGVGIGLELLSSAITGEEFNLNNAASMAASGAISARMSRRTPGAHTDAPGPSTRSHGDTTPDVTPTNPRPSLLDRFRRFDPGGVTTKLDAGIQKLGGKIGGNPVDGPTTVRSPTETADTPEVRPSRHEEVVAGRKIEVEIGGETHTLSVRLMGNELRLILCSNQCGEILLKVQRMQQGRKGTPEFDDLQKLADLCAANDKLINDVTPKSSKQAIQAADDALQMLRDKMIEIQTKYPRMLDPNINAGAGTRNLNLEEGSRVDLRSHLPDGAEAVGDQRSFVLTKDFKIPPELLNLGPDVEYIYVLRDGITGELLKVGQTEDLRDRAKTYEGKVRLHTMGRTVVMEVQPVKVGTKAFPTAESIEGLVRSGVEKSIAEERVGVDVPHDMEILPWDLGGGRIPSDPGGPGTPGVRGSMRKSGRTWFREGKWNKDGTRATAKAQKLPEWAVHNNKTHDEGLANQKLGQLLRQHGSLKGVADALRISEDTLVGYMKERNLTEDALRGLPDP